MATKDIYLTGRIKWAKGLKIMDEKFKSYSAQFYPSDKSMNEYKSLGLKTTFRMDDEGENFSIRRPHAKLFKNKEGVEEVKVFGLPEVFDNEGNPIDPMKVGNGSEVTVKLQVYDTGYGKGSRLEAIRVDNLITFVPQAGDVLGRKPFAPPFDN